MNKVLNNRYIGKLCGNRLRAAPHGRWHRNIGCIYSSSRISSRSFIFSRSVCVSPCRRRPRRRRVQPDKVIMHADRRTPGSTHIICPFASRHERSTGHLVCACQMECGTQVQGSHDSRSTADHRMMCMCSMICRRRRELSRISQMPFSSASFWQGLRFTVQRTASGINNHFSNQTEQRAGCGCRQRRSPQSRAGSSLIA